MSMTASLMLHQSGQLIKEKTNLNKVEGLRRVLLARCYRLHHLVDICHSPHCGAQEGWSGAHTSKQYIQQVLDTLSVGLQGIRNVLNNLHNLSTQGAHTFLNIKFKDFPALIPSTLRTQHTII